MDLGTGHGDVVCWALTGDTGRSYADLRWPGWESEAVRLRLDHGIAVYPPLWSDQAHRDLPATTRRPVPFAELLAFHADAARQL